MLLVILLRRTLTDKGFSVPANLNHPEIVDDFAAADALKPGTVAQVEQGGHLFPRVFPEGRGPVRFCHGPLAETE